MEKITLARPYAKAVFDLAVEESKTTQWSGFLKKMAVICENDDVQDLFVHPRILPEVLINFLKDVYKEKIFDTALQFLEILLHNKRLGLLKEIEKIFDKMLIKFQQTTEVSLVSFLPVSEDETKRIKEKLLKKLKVEKIEFKQKTDKSLLGGAIVKIGDQVFDGSVKNKLKQLKMHLTF